MFPEAGEAIAEAVSRSEGNLLPKLELAVLDAMRGCKDSARGILRELETKARNSYVPDVIFGHIYSVLGEKEEGLHFADELRVARLEDGTLFAEPGIDLQELDPETRIVRFGERNLFFGGVQAAARQGSSSTGAGDPRRGGVAVSV